MGLPQYYRYTYYSWSGLSAIGSFDLYGFANDTESDDACIKFTKDCMCTWAIVGIKNNNYEYYKLKISRERKMIISEFLT